MERKIKKFEIKSTDGSILFTGEFESFKECVLSALKNKVMLTGANLVGADLSYMDLAGEDLIDVDLTGANLSNADLSGVNFKRSKLINVNLSGSDLSFASLINTKF